MKRIFILGFLLICGLNSVLLAEPTSYFSTYAAAYNIDLSDSITFCGVGNNADYIDHAAPGYSETTLIAYVGVSGTTTDINVSIEWITPPFMYQSASQSNLQRPFEIDLILRERWLWEEGLGIIRHDQFDRTGSVKRLNAQNSHGGRPVFTFADPTDGSNKKYGTDLGKDNDNEYENITSFLDIVLVLPKITENGSYQVGSADDYYASFNIILTGDGISATYHCELNGYYETNKPASMEISLSVVPNANATSINLDDASVQAGGEGLNIGSFAYTTVAGNTNPSEYRAFVSSSLDPTEGGEGYEFVLKKIEETEFNEKNSIMYEVGLDNGSSPVKWYDGKASTQNISVDAGSWPWYEETITWPESFLKSNSQTMHREGDSGDTYRYYDEGDILFRLAENSNVDDLIPGVYKSNIYFHVVADE